MHRSAEHQTPSEGTDERKTILSVCLELALLEVFAHQADPPDFALHRSEIDTSFRVEISQQSFAHGGFVHAVRALREVRENIFDLKDSASGARVYHGRVEECADSPAGLCAIFHPTITNPVLNELK